VSPEIYCEGNQQQWANTNLWVVQNVPGSGGMLFNGVTSVDGKVVIPGENCRDGLPNGFSWQHSWQFLYNNLQTDGGLDYSGNLLSGVTIF
jgi:hypothetical protein